MLLEARGITKMFGSFRAVDNASVTLEQGDILGLIGPNGAGKSTFFNCLTGDLHTTSGKVLFQGQDITAMTPEARAELGLARTFQVPQTFEGMSGQGKRHDRRFPAHLASRGSRTQGARRAGAGRHGEACRGAGAIARHARPQAPGDCACARNRAEAPAAR
jgi:ABC-type uncharacterized transport system ATPase subunit